MELCHCPPRAMEYTNQGTQVKITLFVKSPPNIEYAVCTKHDYEKKYGMNNVKCINQNMLDYISNH